MIAMRRLSGNERIECACCGTPRWGDVGDRVYAADGATYCDETCARNHSGDSEVAQQPADVGMPSAVSWEDGCVRIPFAVLVF